MHKISDVDADERTGRCAVCGPVKVKPNGRNWVCRARINAGRRKLRGRPRGVDPRTVYRAHKKTACEACGFTGQPCQLDVDHIDENHQNNDPANLQTLCANCHRLKTWNAKKRLLGAATAP